MSIRNTARLRLRRRANRAADLTVGVMGLSHNAHERQIVTIPGTWGCDCVKHGAAFVSEGVRALTPAQTALNQLGWKEPQNLPQVKEMCRSVWAEAANMALLGISRVDITWEYTPSYGGENIRDGETWGSWMASLEMDQSIDQKWVIDWARLVMISSLYCEKKYFFISLNVSWLKAIYG